MVEPRQRQEWIDLLRGLAVVGMVWTHSANTFLAAAIQASPDYRTLSFYHGLVAPVFFWVAGFMRGMAAARPGPPKAMWPTVKRLLAIWVVGCLMHMPWADMAKGEFGAPAWSMFLQSDVLNCLAVSSLILLGIERMMAKQKPRAWMAVLLVGLAVVLATDKVATVRTGFILADAYLSKQSGSQFPLFPWFGFACAGFISGNFGPPSWRLALVAGVAAFGLPLLPGETGTVAFFFERLGWVMMIAAAIARLNAHIAWVPRWLMLAGRESLWLYVVHLMLIHAVPWWSGRSLEKLVGATQPMWCVGVIFVALLTVSLAVAWWNERRKQRSANV